jgi:hypothetical protein
MKSREYWTTKLENPEKHWIKLRNSVGYWAMPRNSMELTKLKNS